MSIDPPPNPPVAYATLSPDRVHVWDGAAWRPAQYSDDGRMVWTGAQWLAVPPMGQPGVATGAGLDFEFGVGEQERHRVHFLFDQVVGNLSIEVDGVAVIKELRVVSLKLSKPYRFTVGIEERHDVVIELNRKLLFAGFRPQTCRIWVDGQFVGEYTGQAWSQG